MKVINNTKITTERRKYFRIQVYLPMLYSYINGDGKVTCEGTTLNFSDAGICFYSSRPLLAGLDLEVNISHIWDSPRKSVIRWCSRKMVSPELDKVGVSFQ
jgi:c-di-GMP-binding flagellar brake protein YcgR